MTEDEELTWDILTRPYIPYGEDVETFARIGEVITCDAGHQIGVFIANLYYHDRVESIGHKVRWFQPEPSKGILIRHITCDKCGGKWIKEQQSYHIISLNINGVWR